MKKWLFLLLPIAAGCALNSRTYMNSTLASDEQLRTKAHYETLASRMGCVGADMDEQWKHHRYEPFGTGGTPCVMLGRYGIPNMITETDNQERESATVLWKMGTLQYVTMQAVHEKIPGNKWYVASVTY
jgi:hypothetical protein